MTSVSFPFRVGLPDPSTKQIALEPVEFRFTTRTTRLLERACNGNIDAVLGRGKSVEALVLLVCYGRLWDDPKMTEDRAANLIDEYIDAGGDVIGLAVALYDALLQSGVYGKPKTEERPTTQATATTAAA